MFIPRYRYDTMRRTTKNVLLFIFGSLCIVLYCEYLIYYVVIAQCSWPKLQSYAKETSLKVLALSDTHMLGPRKGYWLDKVRREWEMHRAFQTILHIHHPEVVFILGDVFDEGEWTNNKEFEEYVRRFYKLFAVPEDTQLYVTAGNHDIGFHNNIRPGSVQRFNKAFNSTSVKLLTIKDVHFVLINSMAMEGDSCSLCTEARRRINSVSEILNCAENPSKCARNVIQKRNYSQPILLQHFPLYRKSDSVCSEPDSAPFPERNEPFRLKIDALSKEATDFLVTKLNPRAVFGGHTHHGCLLYHSHNISQPIEFYEYSIPSFSWRNRLNPKYMLITISPEEYAVNKCGLPRETTIAITGVISFCLLAHFILKKKPLGRWNY